MGRNERNRQVVTDEARRIVQEHSERLIGPVLEHGAHEELQGGGEVQVPLFRCPKCRGVQKEDQLCPGKIALLPPEVEQVCQEFGEHLHTRCTGCGFTYRRACADAT